LDKKNREKRREAMLGENNPRWNGGNSDYPNHAEFKRARVEVLQRSKGKCEICGKLATVVHHIDGDKSNHSLDNLIAVCSNCHSSLHREDALIPNLGRPLKYSLICGHSVKQISGIFKVCPGTIYNWIKNPKKEKWFKKQLEALE